MAMKSQLKVIPIESDHEVLAEKTDNCSIEHETGSGVSENCQRLQKKLIDTTRYAIGLEKEVERQKLVITEAKRKMYSVQHVWKDLIIYNEESRAGKILKTSMQLKKS